MTQDETKSTTERTQQLERDVHSIAGSAMEIGRLWARHGLEVAARALSTQARMLEELSKGLGGKAGFGGAELPRRETES